MTQGHEYEAKVLEVLRRAVAEALERKRRLGQYAVMWREGRVCALGQMRQPRLARVVTSRPTRAEARVDHVMASG